MTTLYESLPVFFAIFWKSGVALGAALGINFLLRKSSADLRKLVLSTTVVAMLLAAAAVPVLPRWMAIAPSWLQAARPAPAAGRSRAPGTAAIEDAPEVTWLSSDPAPTITRSRRFDPGPWLIPLIWFPGAATLLARFAIGLHGLRRLRKASTLVTDAGLLADVARYGRDVRLWRSETIAAPVTWGILRPVILVPAAFAQLSAGCRDAVLCHELAHIQEYDFLMRCLSEIARALIWFQPLMWIVLQQLREEQELVCDNRVLAAGGKPSAYARLLMDWECRPGMDSLIAVGIAHRSCLKRRLYALLDPDLRRDTVPRAGVAGAWVVGLAAALPLAAISFTEAAPVPPAPQRVAAVTPPPVEIAQAQPPKASVQEPAAQTAPSPRFDVASVKRCMPGDEQTGVGGRGGGGGRGPRFSPGRLTVKCMDVGSMIGLAYIEGAEEKPASYSRSDPVEKRIRGGQPWVYSDWYTIEAETDNPEANGSTDRGFSSPAVKVLIGPMLRAVLAERFQLRIHPEVEQTAIYALAVAKGGLKIQPLKAGDCRPLVPGQGISRLQPGEKPICGGNITDVNGPNRVWKEVGVSMKTFAGFALSNTLDRHVVDKTGITGLFSFNLEYQPDETTPDRFRQAVDNTSAIPPGPSIFTALEQQLGLKLVPDKGPRGYFVVDHVERPSEN